MRERARWTRLRWRLRGATMWPAFLLGVVVDAVLLRLLPIAGETGPDPMAAVLLAFFFNLVAVAVVAPLAGRLLRRRRPSLPRVVAVDRAGTAVLCALTVGLAAIGLAHRPAVRAEANAFALQAEIARQFVLERAPARFRGNVDHMDTWRQAPGLFRTCVPGPQADRSFCVIVDTGQHPPTVTRDHDQSPNAVIAGPDNPGRLVR